MLFVLRLLLVFTIATLGGIAVSQETPTPAARPAQNGQAAPSAPTADRWEATIAKFEAEDRKNPPPKGAVLFVGSSSIVGWKTLKSDFPGMTTLNRGFGGSGMRDLVRYMDRIVIPYAPKTIVVYTGENDLAASGTAKRTAEQVFADFQAFVRHVRKTLPETRIVYITMKPSPRRWNLWPEMQKGNRLISDWFKSGEAGEVSFVDVGTHMLGKDGKPRPELYKDDRLHMTPEGYKLWTRLVAPALREEQPI
jgi:lysophospholipase L1-like esterase